MIEMTKISDQINEIYLLRYISQDEYVYKYVIKDLIRRHGYDAVYTSYLFLKNELGEELTYIKDLTSIFLWDEIDALQFLMEWYRPDDLDWADDAYEKTEWMYKQQCVIDLDVKFYLEGRNTPFKTYHPVPMEVL